MPSSSLSRILITSSLSLLIGGGIVYATISYFNYAVGTDLPEAFFYTTGSGNAGKVTLNGSYRSGGTLEGSFWIQTVGTGTFEDPTTHTSAVHIAPPGAGNPTRTCWTVTGTGYSQNAGDIILNGAYADLRFNPISQKLEGYGWNDGIGKIPFGDMGACGDTSDNGRMITDAEMGINTTPTGSIPVTPPTTIAANNAGFIGKVKILGNAGGSATNYGSIYNEGTKFNANILNDTLQRMRKNVALLTRNIPDQYKNSDFTSTHILNHQLFYINTGNANQTLKYGDTSNSASDSFTDLFKDTQVIIIVGGDIEISTDIINSNSKPKAIIVLKDQTGTNGGNIYIRDSVKKIEATLFTEGSIYSGDDSGHIYNDAVAKIPNIPGKQLWIKGSVMSHNTIGGAISSATDSICPYSGDACTFDTALKYDFNYFRAFDKTATGAVLAGNRSYNNNTLDDYSLIIEHDPRFISNPPPGF